MERKLILSKVYKLLEQISDSDFQERTWVRGEGKEISTYIEVMCSLFDDFNLDGIIEKKPIDFNLSDQLISSLKTLRDALNNYDDESKSHFDIINDPNWKEIQKMSYDILPLFKKEMVVGNG
jgi:hypothetical protein